MEPFDIRIGSDPNRSSSEICQDELYSRDALGSIVSQLFQGKGELFGVPFTADPKHFHLLSVFVKEGRSRLVHVGSLCKDGGLLVCDAPYDLLRVLMPHLHSVTKQDIDQHVVGVKQPFTRTIREFRVKTLDGRPEGRFFSWLEMGCTKMTYIDQAKLSARLEGLRVDPSSKAFRGHKHFYLVHKICHSERLHYYRSTRYKSNAWLGKDMVAITSQIKGKTKTAQRLGVCSNKSEARAFCLFKVNFDADGSLGAPDYDVQLIPACSTERSSQDNFSFFAEVLDHDYLLWLVSELKGMRTKHIWQPAIKDLYTQLDEENRKVAIKYLLDTVKKFQTEDEQAIQMVDLSFAISNIPPCFETNPSILATILRGVEIVLTQPQDSDDESPEMQIVFQPVNCQPTLKIMEQLLTVLDKGVVTNCQGEAAVHLLPTEVVSLQELFYTQMACVCSPWKNLNPKEEPLLTLWKMYSPTRKYLESVGLHEQSLNDQKVVVCPQTSELINILSIFFLEVD